jgi:hypothetical protein
VIAIYGFAEAFCVYLLARTIMDIINGGSLSLGCFAAFLIVVAIAWGGLRIQVNRDRLRQDAAPQPRQ